MNRQGHALIVAGDETSLARWRARLAPACCEAGLALHPVVASGPLALDADNLDLALVALEDGAEGGLATLRALSAEHPALPCLALGERGHAAGARAAGSRGLLAAGDLEPDGPGGPLLTALSLARRLRREREAFEAERTRISNLIERNGDGMVVVDAGGRVLMANRAAERLLGPEQVALEARFPYEVAVDHTVVLDRLGSAEEPVTAEMRVVQTDWEGRPVYLLLLRDISEQRQTERQAQEAYQALARARDQLESRVEERTAALARVNRDLETLLTVVSHDLKEPLRAVTEFSQLVLARWGDRLEQTGRDYLERVCAGARRMRAQLDDILLLSRARKLAPPASPIAAQEMVRQAVERLEAMIEATGARVEVADDLPELRLEPTWAVEAVYNLLSNALKFTMPGTPPCIEVAAYQPAPGEPGGRGLVVADRGPGVDPAQAEEIFELFRRAVGREVEGTGAGLTIVRQVAERHGGAAWVRPRPGGGSEFVLTFEGGSYCPPAPAGTRLAASRRLQVLVVEDCDDDLLLLREALETAGLPWDCEFCNDGLQALQRLRRHNGSSSPLPLPDLLLLDINMPRLDGWQVLDLLKGDPALRRIPVVMLTASRRPEDVERSFAAGACSYLHKPDSFRGFCELLTGFAGYWAGVTLLPGQGEAR